MRPLLVALVIAAAGTAAGQPSSYGIYFLESSLSKSDFNPVARMTVSQSARRFRMEQSDKDGMTAHSVQGECALDGVRHGVPEAEDEWITCRWAGSVLVTEQNWDGAREKRTTRTSLNAAGKLVQDIQTSGATGAKSAHLVWTRQVSAPEPTDAAAPAR